MDLSAIDARARGAYPALVLDQFTRRQAVADRIVRGALPSVGHERAAFGPGRGYPCHACGEPVLCSQVEVSASFRVEASRRFHVDCFGIWRVAVHDASDAQAKQAAREALTSRRS
jgi:hypothetical protein